MQELAEKPTTGGLQVERSLNGEWYDNDDSPKAGSWFVVGRCFLEMGVPNLCVILDG